MTVRELANKTICKPQVYTDVRKRNYNTTDIVELVMEIAQNERAIAELKSFSIGLRELYPSNDLELFVGLWRFLYIDIKYRRDPRKKQWVRSPARLWADGMGDCKSYTIFVTAVLQNLGIRHFIRFTAPKGEQDFKHVYAVAMVKGEHVVIDGVYHSFNKEESYSKKRDIMPELAVLWGTQEAKKNGLSARWLPTTTSTDGELSLHLMRRQLQLLSLLTSNERQRVTLKKGMDILDKHLVMGIHNAGGRTMTGNIPKELEFLGSVLMKAAARGYGAMDLGHKAGIAGLTNEQIVACDLQAGAKYINVMNGQPCDPVLPNGYPDPKCDLDKSNWSQNIFLACKDKKEWENIVNNYLEDTGPTTIYAFGAGNYITSTATHAAKRLEQLKFIGGINYVSGISSSNVKAFLRNGVLASELSAQPEQVVTDMATANIGGVQVGFIAAVTAIIAAVTAAIIAIIEACKAFDENDPALTRDAQLNDYMGDSNVTGPIIGPDMYDWDYALLDTTGSGSGGGTGNGGTGNGGTGNGGTGSGSGNGSGNGGSSNSTLILGALALGYLYTNKNS